MKSERYLEDNGKPSEGQELAAYDEEFCLQFPILHELLTVQHYKGKSRETWTIRIYAEGGRFKCSVTDRHGKRSGHLTIDSPSSCFDALERALEGSSLELRSWSPQTRRV